MGLDSVPFTPENHAASFNNTSSAFRKDNILGHKFASCVHEAGLGGSGSALHTEVSPAE